MCSGLTAPDPLSVDESEAVTAVVGRTHSRAEAGLE